jgi:hypothetical protein
MIVYKKFKKIKFQLSSNIVSQSFKDCNFFYHLKINGKKLFSIHINLKCFNKLRKEFDNYFGHSQKNYSQVHTFIQS